jgi:histidine triad (HIT) family protein
MPYPLQRVSCCSGGSGYTESMNDTIFTKIIKGEIPCHKIYEDELTFAFLDIHPVQPGHVLVIPKQQIEFVWDLDDALYQAVMATVKKVAERCKAVLNVPYVGLQVIGVDVPHAHVHVIPFSDVTTYKNSHPDMNAAPDNEALADIANKLAF